MTNRHNAIYIMGGGGTSVVSSSAFALIERTYSEYRDKIERFYAAVGGMRGALHEDLTDVFRFVEGDGQNNIRYRLNTLKFPPWPVFRTSRHDPNDQDCERLLDVLIAHNIRWVFLNGGNDTMEKAIRLKDHALIKSYEIYVIGIPKTVDNDLLITHRSPGYMSFAKQVVYNVISLNGDLNSFSIPNSCKHEGGVKEGAVAQIMVLMGRDQGWGAASGVLAKIEEDDAPHVILTKEGGFSLDRFLNRCQNAFDRYNRLFVVASEGAHDGIEYLGYKLKVSSELVQRGMREHTDPHRNNNVTDSRLGILLKLIIEENLKIPAEVYKDVKAREDGPSYLNRAHLDIVSHFDLMDAINVGARAADLAFGHDAPIDGVMVTLTTEPGETSYTPLYTVADPKTGSKRMTKSIKALSSPYANILTQDGMMVNKELFKAYAEPFIDLDGPNRREILRNAGFAVPPPKYDWTLEKRLLNPYQRLS